MPALSFLAILHYVGHSFAGWQRQKSHRTIQGEFERVLERVAGRPVRATAAGRTDAGVHAVGQAVSFTPGKEWSEQDLRRAMNALLPDDIWVAATHRVPTSFNARRDALSRRYCYVIGCDAASSSPFRHPFEWALGHQLDHTLLEAARRPLAGEHDFQAFSAAGQPKPHYRCSILSANWEERPGGKGYIFTIEADRFLHRMVRFLVGTMADVAQRRRPVEDMARLLAETSNADASPPAPPEGLYLVGVRYRNGYGTDS